MIVEIAESWQAGDATKSEEEPSEAAYEPVLIKSLLMPNRDRTTNRDDWFKLLHGCAQAKYCDTLNSCRAQVARFRLLVKDINQAGLRVLITPFHTL